VVATTMVTFKINGPLENRRALIPYRLAAARGQWAQAWMAAPEGDELGRVGQAPVGERLGGVLARTERPDSSHWSPGERGAGAG